MIAVIRRHPVLVAAFALALALSLFFAGRITYRAVYWSQHRFESVQPWMTVGYVGRSWGLDPRAIDARAGLPIPDRGHPLTLEQIARDRGVPVAQIIGLVEETVAAMRAEDGAPAPGKAP